MFCRPQEAGDNNQFCWRNLFSCINLLRILNKLTKWKHSRTMVRRRLQTGVKGWLWFHVDATQGGLRTLYVLADPPCVHRMGLTCASQEL